MRRIVAKSSTQEAGRVGEVMLGFGVEREAGWCSAGQEGNEPAPVPHPGFRTLSPGLDGVPLFKRSTFRGRERRAIRLKRANWRAPGAVSGYRRRLIPQTWTR